MDNDISHAVDARFDALETRVTALEEGATAPLEAEEENSAEETLFPTEEVES